jgi:hypothetical protein
MKVLYDRKIRFPAKKTAALYVTSPEIYFKRGHHIQRYLYVNNDQKISTFVHSHLDFPEARNL